MRRCEPARQVPRLLENDLAAGVRCSDLAAAQLGGRVRRRRAALRHAHVHLAPTLGNTLPARLLRLPRTQRDAIAERLLLDLRRDVDERPTRGVVDFETTDIIPVGQDRFRGRRIPRLHRRGRRRSDGRGRLDDGGNRAGRGGYGRAHRQGRSDDRTGGRSRGRCDGRHGRIRPGRSGRAGDQRAHRRGGFHGYRLSWSRGRQTRNRRACAENDGGSQCQHRQNRSPGKSS